MFLAKFAKSAKDAKKNKIKVLKQEQLAALRSGEAGIM